MNIFICHYGAVRAFSLGFLEEVLKMFQCGETNILQVKLIYYKKILLQS